MSEYDEQEFADGCMNYSEFNTGSGYLAYAKDLNLPYIRQSTRNIQFPFALLPHKQDGTLSEFDVLLITSRQCLDIPEEYINQAVSWLCENNAEGWSASEGKLA